MHKRFGILLTTLAALLSFQVSAQSSHDTISGVDHDLADSESDRFEIASPNGRFKMGLKGHIQEHNQYRYDSATKKHDFGMEIKRARFSVLGNVLDPRVSYLFQIGLESDQPSENAPQRYNAPGLHILRDYYLNLSTENTHFQARIGKFRTPFSRQQLMSTSQMQFYDQSDVNEEFQLTTSGRDVGIMFHNGWSNPIEWALAAVTNGIVGRLGLNVNEIDGYDLTDFAQSDFRFAFALNGFLHTDYKSMPLDDIRGGADFIIKAHGFSTNGAFYYQRLKEGDAKALNNLGGGIDLGYLINTDTDGKIEPVLRYSWIKADGANEPHQHQIVAGLNYYVFGHHLKFQPYVGTGLEGTKFVEWLGGVLVQLAF